MYKVIIVDDEYIIRQGMETSVKWEEYGCKVVGTAESGETGLQLIRQCKPDIIFTDIEMDNMSGLEMLDKAREENRNSKVIIITGYRKFEYAKRAIDLGAFAYILKPTKLTEIHKILGSAVAELDSSKASTGIAQEERMGKLFYQYINGVKKPAADEIADIMEYYKDVGDVTMVVAVTDECGDALSNGVEDIISIAKSILQDRYMAGVPINSEQVVFLIKNCDSVREECYAIQDEVKSQCNFTISMGISSDGIDITDLHGKYLECKSAAEQRAYIGAQAVISVGDAAMFFKYEDYVFLNKLRDKLIDEVIAEKNDEAQQTIKSIFEFFTDSEQEENNISDYYWGLLAAVEKTANNFSNLDEINAGKSLNELNAMLSDITAQSIEKISRANLENTDPKVLAMKNYIKENYMKQITLSDLAKHVYVSTYYASRIFKKSTGMSINEYMNIVRIEKAKELLADVRYKMYEVAEYVGINDQRYFSKLMKTITGYSPSEYRKRKLKSLDSE